MKKTTLAAAFTSLMLLAACSDKAQENQPAAASVATVDVCANPALNDAVKTQAQQHFETIRQFSQQNPDLYDEAKLLGLFNQLNIQVSEAKTINQNCQTQLRIAIPTAVWDLATNNAPLAQKNAPKDLIQANTTSGNIHFDGENITLPLNYVVQNNNTFAIQTQDENLKSAMRLLAEALASYGIKDTVTYQGKSMSREDALHLLRNPKPIEIASVPATSNLEAVEPIGDNIAEPPRPEQISASADAVATEALQPETASTQNKVPESELNQARDANDEATASIKSAWRKIPPNIQESLVEEQRNWESKKRQSCRNAGAKGSDAAQIQYLQIQCDTRLTRERVQYLQGFSIDE